MMTKMKCGLVLAMLTAMTGCALMDPPQDLDVRTTRSTAQGRYVVSIRPLVEAVLVNRIHPWEIDVKTAGGAPVTGAAIQFQGGMPQHFHGFPTQPRVTDELGDGRYRLDGVKFSMTGWWEMKLTIRSQDVVDQVTFNTVVAAPKVVP